MELEIDLQTTQGKSAHRLQLTEPSACLSDLLILMQQTVWGQALFQSPEQPGVLVAGHLLVYNGRMVQPWEVPQVSLADGKTLKIVQVVPGG
jgi:hypothetical protein